MNPYDYHDPQRVPELTPGDYYANKDRAARYWYAHLTAARKRGAPEDEIRWLERKLEAARYVGD